MTSFEFVPQYQQEVTGNRKRNNFDNINVVVRVRPNKTKRAVEKHRDSLFPAAGQIQVTDPISGQQKSFTFDVVFEPEATQEEVFEHSGIKRLIDMALEGDESEQKNGSEKCVGLIHLSFAYLFEQINRRKDRGIDYIVTASYLEIYNEQVLDLLNPSPKSLNVRWSKDRGFFAENLFKVECEDFDDLEGVLEEGSKIRQVRSHQMNESSSRSHTLLTITLASETQDPEDPQGYIRREGRLCLVDLAGSEKTKRTLSKGDTLIEANNINRSLLVLGNCISSLASSKRRSGHIPYRDSTLTKLLADSLSGSGMTLMIACISQNSQDASETINTLRYASRAKKVKTNPVVRMDHRELLILSLKREVRLLRMENNYLRQQLNLGTGYSVLNGSDRPTSNESNTSPIEQENKKEQEKQEELKTNLIHKYMRENESLRAENSQLHHQREQLIHDHEKVVRENERLKRRIDTPTTERANPADSRRPSIIALDTLPESKASSAESLPKSRKNISAKSNIANGITEVNNRDSNRITNGHSDGLQLEVKGTSAVAN
ncbi:kinesin-like protein KIF12, partial [Dinothrombium tinctorium]